MAAFKCKMCGGALDVAEGESIITCGFCDTKQTLPKLGDDRKATLYDRAGHFRRGNEYDKASAIYETILNEDSTDSEAYWSIVLCKYGVEYVEDPVTRRRVPTCNRTQLTSILTDENYKQAVENAEGLARSIYEEEARAIDAIQRGILEISNKEEPFDVFICYKELGEDGQRTRESVLAQDIYQQLTKDGYKVFFSRITLEKKLGQQYEPYIFAALKSAKVMLVVGTKPEHFNAVWVKNEWSRFLALAKDGGGKLLIPCYRDMDVYDLPDELSMLQSQDMGKIGFLQDLMHGVKKVLDAGKPSASAAPTAASGAVSSGDYAVSPAANALLERAFIFLEDGDWKQADEYCERVLDADPKNARAYIGKLCAELNVRQEKNLPNVKGKTVDRRIAHPDVYELLMAGKEVEAIVAYRNKTNAGLAEAKDYVESMPSGGMDTMAFTSLKGYSNYNKALRFADPDYLKILEGYEQAISDRIKEDQERRAESEREAKYGILYAEILITIELSKRSPLSASNINMEYVKKLKQAAEKLRDMDGYQDSLALAGDCDEMAEAGTEMQYAFLMSEKETTDDYDILIALSERFKELEGYKDSIEMGKECFSMAYEIKEKERLESLEEKYTLVLSMQSKLNESDSASSSKLTLLANACKELYGYKDSGDMEKEFRRRAAEALEKEREAERMEQEAERAAKFEEPYNALVREKKLFVSTNSIQPGMFEDMAKRFEKMDGYKDSVGHAYDCSRIALEQRKKQVEWKEKGLCIMCGGQIGGLRTKKCKSCGYEPRR